MATNVLFDDNFSEYSPGDQTITGFYNLAGCTVVDFGTMTGSSSAPGFFERTGHGLTIPGTPAIKHQDINPVTNFEFIWSGFPTGNSYINPQVTIANANLSGGTSSSASAVKLCGISFNTDFTASFVCASTESGGLYSGSAYIATTEQQVIYPYTWQYYQAQFALSAQLVLGLGTVIVATCAFGVNGTLVLTGIGTTGILLSDLWTDSAQMNEWQFGGGGWLGDMYGVTVTGTDTLPTIGYRSGTSTVTSQWPHPGSPLDALYTQSTVETIKLPSFPHSRVTQGIVEIPRRPSQRYARVTQGVIEVIRPYTPSPPYYWTVWEA